MGQLDPALLKLLPEPAACPRSAAFVTLVANESFVAGPPPPRAFLRFTMPSATSLRT
jgi:hypothetical protein